MVGCDDDVGGDDGVEGDGGDDDVGGDDGVEGDGGDDDGKEGSCGVVLDRLDNQAGKTRAST